MDFRDSMQLCPGHADNGSDEHSNASPLPKNDQKWEQHKDEIERFYIRENHSLPLTMHEFQTRYGLKASVRKWKMVLDAWKFSKNLRTEEMLFVVAKGEKRAGEEGKETLFLHGGTQITREKIEKFKRRRIAYPKQVDDVNARTPEAITYFTPPPSDSFFTHGNQSSDSNIADSNIAGPFMTQNSDSPDTSDQHAVDQSQQSSLEETCRFHPAGRTCIYCGLSKVPRHVMINILKFLEIEDVFALGITCKGFRYLITDEEVGCQVLQEKAPYSKETLMSMNSQGRYASAFRRVVKRRQALNTASPFACAVLGFADTYLYCQGLLCYTLDDRLRILDLHNSGGNEVVISISNLLQHSIPEVYDSQRGVFEILYASNGIISCLFNRIHCQPRTWLIAFHVESRRTLVVEPFEPNPKIFARQNQRFLYFGTNSGFLIGGFEKWAIKCYDFKRMKWFDKILHVTDIGGSEIGSTICFEVVNDALIAVTNRASWRDEGVDCVSFYSCFSFRPIRGRLETLAESAWRRYHAEGPIDDRWTSLHLEIDETGGFVKIVESRKEWYKGSSTSGLRYYTTNFAFHEVAVREMQHDMPITTRMKEKHSQLPVSFLVSHDSNPPEPNSGSLTLEDSTQFTEKAEALIRLLRREDHPHHLPLPLRTVDMVHPVRHGSSEPTFTQAKIKGRYYSAPASTVLYLVDDPLPTDWQGRQRLRLRVDSRSLGPPLQDRDGFWVKHLPYDLSLALGSMYISSPITFWPPSQYPGFDQADESVDKIYGILNPPAFLGNVKSTTDERSLVYTTGDINGPQAIVFISFDPAIKLQGLKKWESGRRPVRSYVDVGELDRTVILGRVGRPADTSSKGAKVIISSTKLVAISEPGREVECESGLREFRRGDSVDWIWKESAMYRDVGRGYDFGL